MSMRAHVHTKHEIELGAEMFGNSSEVIMGWLGENCVQVYETHNFDSEEWEVCKDELEAIPDSAYKDIDVGEYCEITADELRAFVKELLAAPTGDYAYVSWF